MRIANCASDLAVRSLQRTHDTVARNGHVVPVTGRRGDNARTTAPERRPPGANGDELLRANIVPACADAPRLDNILGGRRRTGHGVVREGCRSEACQYARPREERKSSPQHRGNAGTGHLAILVTTDVALRSGRGPRAFERTASSAPRELGGSVDREHARRRDVRADLFESAAKAGARVRAARR